MMREVLMEREGVAQYLVTIGFVITKGVKQSPLCWMISGGICGFIILSQSPEPRLYAPLIAREASSIGKLIIPLMLNRAYEIYSCPNLDASGSNEFCQVL